MREVLDALDDMFKRFEFIKDMYCSNLLCETCVQHDKNDCPLLRSSRNLQEFRLQLLATKKLMQKKFEIRAGDYWISKRKFDSKEEAEKAIVWVVFLLSEKEENVRVVPVV